MLALVVVLLCAPPAGQLLELRQGTLTYTVVHKLHEVRGTTREVEGRALAQPDGTVRVQVRAKVASFDSGNSKHDEHVRGVTHEHVHRYAEVNDLLTGAHRSLLDAHESSLHVTVYLTADEQP